jgi:shikimate kinase
VNKKTSNKTPKTKTTSKKSAVQADGAKICLLGFMGAGKTTTAQILAEKMGVQWIDLDEFIEVREKRQISQIIENLGEAVFREVETDALREALHGEDKRILALGGGTWTVEANRSLIAAKNCRTVWLDVPFEMCWERIANSKHKRPLAVAEEKARELYDERRNLYETAEMRVVLSPEKSSADLAAEIYRILGSESSKSAAQNKTRR